MKYSYHFAATAFLIIIAWYGIIPSFRALDTDFPNYYTSSRLLIEGSDVSRIYDDGWFQKQINRYGMNQPGKFSPFPPVTAFIMTPLSSLSPLNALRVWSALNIVLLAVTIYLLTKILEVHWLKSATLVLSSGIALINNFRFGQFYLAVSACMIAGYYWHQSKKQFSAGAALGFGAAFKYFPVVLLPVFIQEKRWGVVLSCIAVCAGIHLLGVAFMGINTYESFFSGVFQSHVAGNIQQGYSAAFQSWDSFLRRTFVYSDDYNPFPALAWESGYTLAKTIVLVIVLGTAAIAYRKASFIQNEKTSFALRLALLAITGMTLLPASATYHFLLMILPVGLLLATPQWNLWQKVIAMCYGVIGILPYKYFRLFEGKGIYNALAYPRLWLLCIIFAATIAYLLTYRKKEEQGETI